MLAGSGRPRTACSMCKAQKIRCTGERPACKRCSRLRHTCVYDCKAYVGHKTPSKRRSASAHLAAGDLSPGADQVDRNATTIEVLRGKCQPLCPPVPLPDSLVEDYRLGIPTSLVLILVEVYYDNVYNANLLLPKGRFLETMASGTFRPHVILGVCAWAANFYRDASGQASLKDHGFMLEWAHRAGKLVFQEAEDLLEDNIVTFTNLALFWHAQGSWRKAALHKGNACQTLYIMGLGSEKLHKRNLWESEISRRRFWACYLMHCHTSEKLSFFELAADMEHLPLPWPEDDFDVGVATRPQVTLRSGDSNGGVFSEMIKVLTFWSSVVTLMKSSEADISTRITSIHALDTRLSDWWKTLPTDLKLTASNVPSATLNALPKKLLLNIAYHQSLCALHASIVPLFCWTPSDESWSTARQLSAQVAFEHAKAVSVLLTAVLASYPRLSAMPSFVAYAAYSGCAIQIPFMWCTNKEVRKVAQANVKTNVKMIDTMASYWKFTALLRIHVRALYDIHKRNPPTLEHEPKSMDVNKLTSFQMNSSRARSSILEGMGILRTKREGFVQPGDERSMCIEDELGRSDSNDGGDLDLPERTVLPSDGSYPSPSTASPFVLDHEQQNQQQTSYMARYQTDLLSNDSHAMGVLYPFFDAGTLDLFPNGEMLDLAQFDTDLLNVDGFATECS